MRYYPVNLDLKGKKVVVIGAGSVAYRKVSGLIEAGAQVKVVSPESHGELKALADQGAITLEERGYASGDLHGFFAAIAATDRREINLKIREEATGEGVLLNIVDKPEFCDFVFPAKVVRGEFMLTISTGGASPAFAKKVREELERQFGDEYGRFVALLADIRGKIIPENRRKYEEVFTRFVRSPIFEAVRQNDFKKIRLLVKEYFGEEFL